MELTYEETMQRIAELKKDSLKKRTEMLIKMDLGYERTMYQIKKHEKELEHKFCTEKHYPWSIDVFKGEHRLIIVPYITTIFWYATAMARYRILNENESPDNIGKAILESFEHISISPVDARTPAERDADSYWNETKCKSYKTFTKKYSLCCAMLNEDGTYIIAPCERLENYNGYGGVDTDDPFRFKLPKEASAEEIGNAVMTQSQNLCNRKIA